MSELPEVTRLELDELELVVVSLPREARSPVLTPSEEDVVKLVLEGHSNREIASLRHVSVKTVANQLRCIYQKLGVASRFELAARLGRW